MRSNSFLSAVPGIGWGLIGYGIVRETNLRSVAWVGLAASPLIGIGIGVLADRISASTWIARVLFSLLSLYIAVALFAMVISCASVLGPLKAVDHALHASGPSGVLAIFFEGMVGFTISGYWLILWPLAAINHFWLWSRRDQLPTSLRVT